MKLFTILLRFGLVFGILANFLFAIWGFQEKSYWMVAYYVFFGVVFCFMLANTLGRNATHPKRLD